MEIEVPVQTQNVVGDKHLHKELELSLFENFKVPRLNSKNNLNRHGNSAPELELTLTCKLRSARPISCPWNARNTCIFEWLLE